MKISYEGIGQWAATFACDGAVPGQVVKITENDTAGPCDAGDSFGGVTLSVSRDGEACSVALGGLQTVSYSGDSAPALGWSGLCADGAGGVKTDGGTKTYLVVSVNTAAKTVTFAL